MPSKQCEGLTQLKETEAHVLGDAKNKRLVEPA